MNKEEKQAISRFAINISDLLGISAPKIRFRSSVPGTNTTLAACSSDGMEVVVSDRDPLSFDVYFSLAHELRHVWQIRTAPGKYMLNYKTRDELDVEAYNLQPAEIDANAFAEFICVNLFQKRPLFPGLSENIKEKIFHRAVQIAKEL